MPDPAEWVGDGLEGEGCEVGECPRMSKVAPTIRVAIAARPRVRALPRKLRRRLGQSVMVAHQVSFVTRGRPGRAKSFSPVNSYRITGVFMQAKYLVGT
jgi:hypothetical protein